MELEWLKNYELKEYEKIERSEKDLLSGKITAKEAYPYFDSAKIKNPCAVATAANLWVQLSLFETVFLEIPPCSKNELCEVLKITSSDFDQLIDLGKKGKIQFMIKTFPDEYRHLDYLDPIFSELNPQISYALPDNRLTDKDIHSERIIFEENAKTAFLPYLANEDISGFKVDKGIFGSYFSVAYQMKLNNLLELRQWIYDLMVSDPDFAADLFHIFERMLRPSTDPLVIKFNATTLFNLENINFDRLKSNNSANMSSVLSKISEKALPYEIGKIIVDTAVPNVKTFEDYLQISDFYESNDLYSLMQAFYQGVTVNDYDLIQGNANELKVTMKNLWDDAKNIPIDKKAIKSFTSLSIGAIGQIVNGTSYAGCLSFFGLWVLDKVLPPKFSDFALKLGYQNFTLAIFKFSEQHKNFKM